MARRCTVCDHSEVYTIDVRLRDRAPYAEISEEFGVTKSALSRHKSKHLGRARKQETGPRKTARKLVNDPAVVDAIQERLQKAGEELGREDVVSVIETVIRSDMRAFMEWDEAGKVTLKSSAEVGPAALAIKTFKKVGDHMVPVLYDKSPLLRLLGAELGLTTEREAQTIRIVHGSPDGEEAMDLPPVKVVRGQVTDGNGDGGGEEGSDP